MQIVLNLLPPLKKKALQNELILAHFQSIILILLVTVTFAIGTLIIVRTQLNANYQDLARRSSDSASAEATADLENIKQTNAYLRRVRDIQSQYISWSEIVEAVTAIMPPDTRLENLQIDQDGKVHLTGVAKTRDGALELLKRLKGAPFLKDVQSPLTNILQKDNVSFDFEMHYAKAPAAGQ